MKYINKHDFDAVEFVENPVKKSIKIYDIICKHCDFKFQATTDMQCPQCGNEIEILGYEIASYWDDILSNTV